MHEHVVRMYWRVLKSSFEWGYLAVAGALLLIGVQSVYLLQEYEPERTVLGLSSSTALAVMGSVLASVLFWMGHAMLSFWSSMRQKGALHYYQEVHDRWGVLGVLDQRGAVVAQELYRTKIRSARRQVWAIGMTNKSFLSQNLEEILNRMLSEKNLVLTVVFWDPAAEVLHPRGKVAFLDQQSRLEGDSSVREWRSLLESSVKKISEGMNKRSLPLDRCRVVMARNVTSFSALVIDDDVFFFPFLAGSNSNLNPHLHLSCQCGIGLLLVNHLRLILEDEEVSAVHEF